MLLYCNNSVVVGTHEDEQEIPADAYGTGTRIVPWIGNLSDLPLVGTAPPADYAANYIDNRPYAQPTETPAILLRYAAQVRWQVTVKGITFAAASGSIPVKTDRVSQALVNNLAQHAATLAPTAPLDFTQANVHYAITAQEAIDMFNAIQAHNQQARTVEAQCIADLNLATPTILTYADVDTRFAGL
jgi:hypothetical protein